MNVVDCAQGTDEWFAARLGKVSASRVADIVAKTKTGWSASRANYAAELVAERLTGSRNEKFQNDAMRWGSEHEAEARTLYEFMRDTEVTPVGLVLHSAIDLACASPDGLVGDDGLVEIKCPNTATHINTLLGGSVEGRYVTQIQWQLACTGRAWCDFVSFDPRMPAEMQLFVQRVPRNNERIAELEAHVSAFLSEVTQTVADLKARYALREAA